MSSTRWSCCHCNWENIPLLQDVEMKKWKSRLKWDYWQKWYDQEKLLDKEGKKVKIDAKTHQKNACHKTFSNFSDSPWRQQFCTSSEVPHRPQCWSLNGSGTSPQSRWGRAKHKKTIILLIQHLRDLPSLSWISRPNLWNVRLGLLTRRCSSSSEL